MNEKDSTTMDMTSLRGAFLCPPLWLVATVASIAMLATGAGVSLSSPPSLVGSTSASAPGSLVGSTSASSPPSRAWSDYLAVTSTGTRNGQPQPASSIMIRRWWTTPSQENFRREVYDRGAQANDRYHFRLVPPASIATSARPWLHPSWLHTGLPKRPAEAVQTLRAAVVPQGYGGDAWALTARALTDALWQGPGWEPDDYVRWWQLFKAIPGVRKEAQVLSETPHRPGPAWSITAGGRMVRVIKATYNDDIVSIRCREAGAADVVIYLPGAVRVSQVPKEVRDHALTTTW